MRWIVKRSAGEKQCVRKWILPMWLTRLRLEAERTLGPDGKRCKKCRPIVVDLVDDDQFDEDAVVVGGDGGAQST